jgi:hypothetical protein
MVCIPFNKCVIGANSGENVYRSHKALEMWFSNIEAQEAQGGTGRHREAQGGQS